MNILNLFKKPKPIAQMQFNTGKIKVNQPEPLFRNAINPHSIQFALHQAENGNLSQILGLYRQLYKYDDNLAADTDVRKEAAKSANFVLPDTLSKQQHLYFTDFLKKFLPTLVDHMVELKLRGALFKQVIYSQNNGLIVVDAFESYKNLDLRVDNNKLVLFDNDKHVLLSDLKFVAIYNDCPVYESLLKYYAFTSFALNNWASFMEIYGKPIRVGKYLPGTSQAEKDQLWNMIQSLGTDLAAMISENTVIEFVEHKSVNASSDLYHSLLKFCRESVTKRILGQTLTTTSQATGSYAMAKVHELVRQDILSGDLRDIALYVSDICTRLNKINFNQDRVEVTLNIVTKTDLEKRIVIDSKLNDIIVIDDDYWYQTYNIPKPVSTKKTKPIASAVFKKSLDHSMKSKSSLPDITRLHDEFCDGLTSFHKIKEASFPNELYKEYARQLSQAILKAYAKRKKITASKDLFEIDWEIQDIEALNAFRAEAFIVAGVNCSETLQMLKDEAEKAFTEGITFDEWRNNIKLKGFSADNPYHLRTNFSTAINSAYLAREWNEYQKSKELFPYLKYTAIMDDKVREEHASWNDLILHIDDDFWKTNYPPNGWNCRCSVSPLSDDDARNDPDFDKKPDPYTTADPMFQQNTAIDKSIWGKWLGKKEVPNKTFKDFGLPKWKDIANSAVDEAPGLIKLKSKEEYKTYFNLHVAGILTDPQNFPVEINKEFFDKLANSRNATERLERLDWIKPTIQNPDEVWLQKDTSTNLQFYIYIKAFKGENLGGFTVVEIDQGQIRTFFEPNRESYFDKNRKGLPVKIK